jgi:hypothetical protein
MQQCSARFLTVCPFCVILPAAPDRLQAGAAAGINAKRRACRLAPAQIPQDARIRDLEGWKACKTKVLGLQWKRRGEAVSTAPSLQQMTSNNNAKASTSAKTNNARPKNGPVRTFKPAEPLSAAALSEAAASPEPLPFAPLQPMAAAPKKGKVGSGESRQQRPINWPEQVRVAAQTLNISLAEHEPTKGHSARGTMITHSKARQEIQDAPIRHYNNLSRNDAQARWALWAVTGCDGQLPSMADGESLQLLQLLQAFSMAEPKVQRLAAMRTLWSGSGEATSLLAQLAKHSGRTIVLDLETFTLSFAEA